MDFNKEQFDNSVKILVETASKEDLALMLQYYGLVRRVMPSFAIFANLVDILIGEEEASRIKETFNRVIKASLEKIEKIEKIEEEERNNVSSS